MSDSAFELPDNDDDIFSPKNGKNLKGENSLVNLLQSQLGVSIKNGHVIDMSEHKALEIHVMMISLVDKVLLRAQTVKRYHNPHMRALFELVNENTEGAVEKRAEIFTLEEIIHSHIFNLKMLRKIYSLVTNYEAEPTELSYLFVNHISAMLEYYSFAFNIAVEEYHQKCVLLDYPEDNILVESGYYQEYNYSNRVAGGVKAHINNHAFGSVANFFDKEESNIFTLLTKIIPPILYDRKDLLLADLLPYLS